MANYGRTIVAKKPLLPRLAMLFALIVFTVQGIATQTHIHGDPLTAFDHVTHASAPTQPTSQDPYDPSNCPLCQEALHSGAYVIPASAQFIVLLSAVAVAPFFAHLSPAATQSQHSWQSRAPPSR